MKVKVVYIWDSETNSYSPDSNEYDVMAQPTPDDRMRWEYSDRKGRKKGQMNLTRGFEMLMYLAGFANDVAARNSE